MFSSRLCFKRFVPKKALSSQIIENNVLPFYRKEKGRGKMLAPGFITAVGLVFNYASTPYINFDYGSFCEYCEEIKLDDSITKTLDYGSAEPYIPVTDPGINCFGYAINVDSWITIDFFEACTVIDDSMYYNRVVPAVVQTASSYGMSLRYLNDLSSPIEDYESRIAFRVARDSGNSFIDFHFMKQHDDGSWSHKLGIYPSVLFNTSYDNTPEYDSAWYYTNVYYNTDTIYFALRG